jgi:uncharacterized membrane protein YeaQ/YmgE (transglycosylase-associated protein family)
LMGIVIWLLVGTVTGWLAGMIVKGYGFSVLGDMVIGGAMADWLLPGSEASIL